MMDLSIHCIELGDQNMDVILDSRIDGCLAEDMAF